VNIPTGYPLLAGDIELLISDSRPEKGVEISVGKPDRTTHDLTGFMAPERAELIAMILLAAARHVRVEQERAKALRRTALDEVQ
jgi:hypothetical protein